MSRQSLPWIAAILVVLLTSVHFVFGLGKRLGIETGYRNGLHAAPEFVAYRRESLARDEAEAQQKQAAFPDKGSSCDRIVLLFTDRRPLDADELCDQVWEIVTDDLQEEYNAKQEARREAEPDRY